jgi:hypothetical protein
MLMSTPQCDVCAGTGEAPAAAITSPAAPREFRDLSIGYADMSEGGGSGCVGDESARLLAARGETWRGVVDALKAVAEGYEHVVQADVLERDGAICVIYWQTDDISNSAYTQMISRFRDALPPGVVLKTRALRCAR